MHFDVNILDISAKLHTLLLLIEVHSALGQSKFITESEIKLNQCAWSYSMAFSNNVLLNVTHNLFLLCLKLIRNVCIKKG